MITMEKLISSTNEGTDILADSIISLMKKAYECGYEEGYAAGHSERRGLFADNENYDCVLIADSAWFDTFEEQHRHCPLIEVDYEGDNQEKDNS